MPRFVTRAMQVRFRNYGELSLPEGLRVKPCDGQDARAPKWFWLDEFPEALFPRGSMIRHDAEHYGLTLDRSDLQEAR